MSSPSIRRSSLVGMVVVSWLSIVLLGGVWVSKTYYDFLRDSRQMREEHYASKKSLVKAEVEDGVRLVEEIRRSELRNIRKNIRLRGVRARAQAEVLAESADVSMSPKAIRKAVVDVASAWENKVGLFGTRGNDVVLIQPFLRSIEYQDGLSQVSRAIEGAVDGDRQIAVHSRLGERRYTLLLQVVTLPELSIRIVSGACLEIAEAAIVDRVVERLEKVHFGEDGYLFGGTWNGLSTVGPAKGKDMWSVVDGDGIKIVQELVEASKRGGGFVSYTMPPLDGRRQFKKVSYALPIADWGWYIGAGVDVDDIEEVIKANRARMEKGIAYQVGLILVGLVVLSMVAFLISRRISRKIHTNTESFNEVWNRASVEGFWVDPDTIHYAEFKELAASANHMLEDRRKAEEMVAESVARFQSLVTNIPGIIYQCMMDDERTMRLISEEVKAVTGYPTSDFLDNAVRSFSSIIDPRDIGWVRQAVHEKVEAHQPFSIEYRILCKDGKIRWVFDRGQAQYDGRGEVTGLDGVIFDITKRREAEEEHFNHLHFLETMERVERKIRRGVDMEDMLEGVLETIRHAFGADRSWLLTPCDPESDYYEVPVERVDPEYPGAKSTGAAIPMDDEARRVMRHALDASAPVAYDPASGREIPVTTRKQFQVKSQLVAPLYPRTGAAWLMGLHQCGKERTWNSDEIQLFKEVSRRVSDALSSMLMYRELKASEERFRTFSEQTMLGLCVVQDYLVKFANQAYCDIFEVSVEEMLALPPAGFLKFVHPDDREFLMKQATKKQAGESGAVARYRWRAVTASGRVKWVEIHSKTVELDGRLAVLVSLLDVTDIHSCESELDKTVQERTEALSGRLAELQVSNERLSLLNELKSSFFTSIGRVLRSPRFPVSGEEGEQLSSMFDTFQEFISIKDGSATWNDEEIELGECVRRAMDIGQALVKERPGITLELDMPEPLPAMPVDSDRIVLALSHLLENGVRCTSEGTISVSTGVRDGSSVAIAVNDPGKGIPGEYLESVFEPFYQLETLDALSEEASGGGLGLALCRSIVEHYGGSVHARSQPGEGSVFTVELPVRRSG